MKIYIDSKIKEIAGETVTVETYDELNNLFAQYWEEIA